jgi:hypothetical protein
MKNTLAANIFGTALLLTSTLLFQSCKKTNKTPSNNNGQCQTGSITAKLDGNSWNACAGALDTLGIMAIGDTSNDHSKILIYFPDAVSAGSTLNTGGMVALDYIYFPINSEYDADPSLQGSGTIKITKYDRSARIIAGTFSGDLKNINGSGTYTTIENGVFSVNY